MNADHERLELIRCCIDGTATDQDRDRLQEMLRQDAGLRRLYARYANIDAALGGGSITLGVPVAPISRPLQGRHAWRPLGAAAAGLVIGLFCASMVWAYAIPSHAANRVVPILTEHFDPSVTNPTRGFPKRANEWSGDMALAPTGMAYVQPREGRHMVLLTRKPKRKLAYAWRIVDLADYPTLAASESKRMEVFASFNTPSTQRPLRYQIRLAALSQSPEEARDIWNNEAVLFDTVLQHVGRNVEIKPGETSWQTVNAIMEIPPGTRSVVISVAAGETDADQPVLNHYLEEVQARFVIEPTLIK